MAWYQRARDKGLDSRLDDILKEATRSGINDAVVVRALYDAIEAYRASTQLVLEVVAEEDEDDDGDMAYG